MEKIEIKDFNLWSPYEGISEGSGRSEKIWLKAPDGEIGLFKYPKVNRDTGQSYTTEHISEHLAHSIGNVIGVKTAKVDIGMYENRVGSMSYRINSDHTALIEGGQFILGKCPEYNRDKLINEANGRYYCIDDVLGVIDHFDAVKARIEMMIFDFLIGNSDRHQDNWAFLFSADDETGIYLRICPLYDNGSSLCAYIEDSDVYKYLGNDITKFQSLVDTKSRSIIRIDGYSKSKPTHREVVKYLLQNYSIARSVAEEFINSLQKEIVDELMDMYPDNLLSEKKRELVKKFLYKKIDILEELLEEV